jgi:hypothetical protein
MVVRIAFDLVDQEMVEHGLEHEAEAEAEMWGTSHEQSLTLHLIGGSWARTPRTLRHLRGWTSSSMLTITPVMLP